MLRIGQNQQQDYPERTGISRCSERDCACFRRAFAAPGSRPAGIRASAGLRRCSREAATEPKEIPDDKDSKEANSGASRCTIEQPSAAQHGEAEGQPRWSGPTRHEAIRCNRTAALTRWRDNACADKSHWLAAAFGAWLSCWGRAQASQARFEISGRGGCPHLSDSG